MLPRISKRSVCLFFADIVAIVFSFILAGSVRSAELSISYIAHPLVIFSLAVFLIIFYIFDFYHAYKSFTPIQTAVQTIYSVAIGGIFLFAVPYLDRTFLIQRTVLAGAMAIIAISVFSVRLAYDALFRSRLLDRRCLIVGTGRFAHEIQKIIRKTQHSGLHVVGFVAESDVYEKESLNIHVAGSISRLLSLISWHNVNLVILAMEPDQKSSEPNVIYALMKQKVQVVSGIHLFEKLDEAVPYHVLDEHYLIDLMSDVKTHNYLKVKRIVDIVFSILLLTVLSPLLLISILILCTQGPKNIFYFQTRIGKDQREFKLFKLKSMMEGRDGKFRITPIGRWMRKYRIDEIPQLFNVLKGDMSLIGPRPEISYFVDRCRKTIPFYAVVFAVRPGLTGWAQVNFQHVTHFRDYGRKFQYNLYYLKNLSLMLDMLILLKTVRTVLRGTGK